MWNMKAVRIEYSRTFNLDDYESAHVGATIDMAPADGQETLSDLDVADAWVMIKDMLRKESLPILQYRDKRRKAEVKFVLNNLPRDLQDTARKVLRMANDDQNDDQVVRADNDDQVAGPA